MTLLQARDLEVAYGAVVAVRGVSLAVEPGQTVAVLGANGAGKTSLLRAMTGLEPVRSGQVLVDDEDVTGQRAERFAQLGIAHVPDNRGLFPSMSVADNLRMGLYGVGRDGIGSKRAPDDAYERVFDHFPILRERREQLAGSMSGGQQQMLTIARALLQQPRLLMIDEMSMGLAPTIVSDLFAIIRELKSEGIAVLLVEQFVGQAMGVADEVVVLEQGRVVSSGSPAELAGDDLAAAYLGGGEDVEVDEVAPPPDSAVESVTASLGPRQVRALERIAKDRNTTVQDVLRDAAERLLDDEVAGRAAGGGK